MNRSLTLQFWTLFSLVLLNFIVQIFYFFHLYYKGPESFIDHLLQIVIMLVTFLCFIIPSILFYKGKKIGFYLLIGFLSVDFLFYLLNAVGAFQHFGDAFFQLGNPDILLRIIFAIGYINLFACGFFIFFLIKNKKNFKFLQK